MAILQFRRANGVHGCCYSTCPFCPGWVGPVAGITNTSAVYVRTRSTIEHMSAQLQRLEAARAHPQHHNRQQQQARSRNPLTIPSATTTAGDSSNSTRSNGASVQFKLQQRQLLKSRRKCLSHHLLQQIQRSYITTDFAGQQVCLLKVYLQYVAQYETQLPVTRAGTFVGMPAGAGDCCAPKLLHAAVTAGLMPTGMAEVWCGSAPGTATKAKTGRPIPVDGLDPTSSRLHMELYGMCDKCKALLGTMLCGYSGLE